MNTEKITLPDGYVIEIASDEGAESPWKAWDCEPPAWVHSDGCFTPYGLPASLSELFSRLPDDLFQPDTRGQVLKALCMGEDVHDSTYDADTPDGWRDAIHEALPERPGRYSPDEYFQALAGACQLLGIPYFRGTSRGYCQGHWAECFFMAPPEWQDMTGVTPEAAPAQLEAAFKLWSAWAWGDVYGVARITRPDGTECDDGACWGFYGADHEASGLMEHARHAVEADKREAEREAAESFRAACADILTLA